MYRKLTVAIGVLLGTTIWVFDVVAQDPVTFERPAAVASPISEAPTIDGEVLDDPAWIGVAPTSGFIQKTPDTGQPVSERTEVYIAYTGDTLYFGVVCYDREPGKIIVADSRRDSELEETDSFQIILDTYRDEQTGFVFGTNPVGIEYDGQVTREGEGSAFSAGGFNKNWDAVWEVSAHTSAIGWSAEFAIPFTTLRYPRAEEQVWTLNMQRNIRRHNEQSFWSPIPIQFEIYRLALAGSIAGLQVPSQRNLKLLPYVLGEVQQENRETTTTDNNFEFGIDLKYSITPSLTLDATYNTDFAQVEVDDFQINLNRFN
ncbi:MAG: carbohydrate binding family 9 domain-containing protein, partial [Acidobacteria bacterium]|nr:carbohydrate binding family 9 domain-containing protein [Candidatus Sulfomarinibacter kjeldsenii]